jgi:hypothetical protein
VEFVGFVILNATLMHIVILNVPMLIPKKINEEEKRLTKKQTKMAIAIVLLLLVVIILLVVMMGFWQTLGVAILITIIIFLVKWLLRKVFPYD